MSLFFQSLVLGVLLGGLYALLAAGLTLYFGVMRVVMIAHSAFLILAAYLAWFFTTETGLDPLLSLVVTVPLFFVIGVADAAAADLAAAPGDADDDVGAADLLDRAGDRGDARLRLQRHPAPDPAALQRRQHRALRRQHRRRQADRLRRWRPSSLGALFLILKKTQFGQALRATIQHPEAARLIGINTDRVAGYGFGLGLATAAIGGTALSLDSTIYPSLHWHWIGPLMAIIVVGGLGSIPGAAIAAMVLGLGAEPAADPARDDLGADHLLRRAVRHPDGAAAGILRRSSCPALLTPRAADASRARPRAALGLLAPGRRRAGRSRAWPPTRSSCRSAWSS